MREILFRGKTKYGKWVEGDFAKPCNIVFTTIGYDELLKQDNVEIYNDEKVIPETIGQFTGLTDKNGKRIFEGDIVKYYEPEQIGYFECDKDFVHFQIHGTHCTPFKCEVIGNIHDNPELLEESNENQTK